MEEENLFEDDFLGESDRRKARDGCFRHECHNSRAILLRVSWVQKKSKLYVKNDIDGI